MSTPLAARDVLNREFLNIRARLIDVAAALDRIDRAEGSAAEDPRLAKIRQGLELLCGQATDRAEGLQLLFSLPYQDNWQQAYGL
jgi:hypothetical protein